MRYLFRTAFCQNRRMRKLKKREYRECGIGVVGGRKKRAAAAAAADTGVRQRLDPDQRAKIRRLRLFDEQLSYVEVARRAEQELGQKFTDSSIGRYCRQEKCVRVARKIAGGSGYKALLQRNPQ